MRIKIFCSLCILSRTVNTHSMLAHPSPYGVSTTTLFKKSRTDMLKKIDVPHKKPWKKPFETYVCSSKSYIPQLFARFDTQKAIYRSRCRFLGKVSGAISVFVCQFLKSRGGTSVFVVQVHFYVVFFLQISKTRLHILPLGYCTLGDGVGRGPV